MAKQYLVTIEAIEVNENQEPVLVSKKTANVSTVASLVKLATRMGIELEVKGDESAK